MKSQEIPDQTWTAFVEEIAARLRSGISDAEVAASVSGTTVTWRGVIDKLDFDNDAPGVSVDMNEVRTDLGFNRHIIISGLAFSMAGDSVPQWKLLHSGQEVTFEATLGSGNRVFPAIEVQTLRSGRSLLSIRLCNARPLLPGCDK